MGILQLLASDNFITVNRTIAKEIGLDEAILLGELASEYNYYSSRDMLEDGYFYSTVENVEDNTTLSDYRQRKAIGKLQDLGIIDVVRKGLPAKRYIRINEEKVFALFQNKKSNFGTTVPQNLPELDDPKFETNNNRSKKNIEKEKERKKEMTYDEIISEKVQDESVRDALREFVKMRKLVKKPMTNRALTSLIKRLYTFSVVPSEQVAAMMQPNSCGAKTTQLIDCLCWL